MMRVHAPLMCSSTHQGQSHTKTGKPNQDSARHWYDAHSGLWSVAIADGHGAAKHTQSHTGSRIAVDAAVEAIAKYLQQSHDWDKCLIHSLKLDKLRSSLLDPIIESWREGIAADYRKVIGRHELPGEDFLSDAKVHQLYGSTLAFAFPIRNWIVLASLGDSDVMWINRNGSVMTMSPPSDNHSQSVYGVQSLCQSNPQSRIRFLSVQKPIGGTLMLASDGVRNSGQFKTEAVSLLRSCHEMACFNPKGLQEYLSQQIRNMAMTGAQDDCTACVVHFPPCIINKIKWRDYLIRGGRAFKMLTVQQKKG